MLIAEPAFHVEKQAGQGLCLSRHYCRAVVYGTFRHSGMGGGRAPRYGILGPCSDEGRV